MKVALVTAGQETLGVEYLSSVLKKNGHEVKLFFDPQTFGGSIFLRIDFLRTKFDLSEKVLKGIIDYKPDLIGFSCMTHNYNWCLRVAEEIKKIKNIPVIFGGIHPTSVPQRVLENECIDMVAVGESELSLLELLNNMKENRHSNDVKGIYYKVGKEIISNPLYPVIDDLDSLPFPDKKIFYDKVPAFRQTYSIMTSRGCPFSCSYCCNDLLRKLYDSKYNIRRRSVDNVISELMAAKKEYWISEVYFTDEVFATKLEWLREFSAKYKEKIGLPFFMYYHVTYATEERIKLLKEAGCRDINFGMQSVSEKIRKEVCHRYYSNQHAERAIKMCRKYNINVYCDQIFGLPFETEDGWSEAVEFYREAKPNIIYSYWLTYYPATSIIDKGREAGILSDEDINQILDGRQSYYHKGTAVKDRGKMLTYQLLYDLLPLLPSKLHEKITRNQWILKIIPKGYFSHFLLVFIAALLQMNTLFIRRSIKMAISKKNVP
jgi:radical SAM superfamily enzyme YgiQ (UPF0313 family)